MLKQAFSSVNLNRSLTRMVRQFSNSNLGVIEVHSKKTINNIDDVPKVEEYTRSLTENVKNFDGFLNCEHKYKYHAIGSGDTTVTCLTKSYWKGLEYWNKWVVSKERNALDEEGEFQNLFDKVEHEVYYKKPETPFGVI